MFFTYEVVEQPYNKPMNWPNGSIIEERVHELEKQGLKVVELSTFPPRVGPVES